MLIKWVNMLDMLPDEKAVKFLHESLQDNTPK